VQNRLCIRLHVPIYAAERPPLLLHGLRNPPPSVFNQDASEDDSPMDEEVVAFCSFRLIPAQPMLSEDGKPVRIGGRALDILVALTKPAGETISKDELITRASPKRSSKPWCRSGNAVGATRISDVWRTAGRRLAALM
jgi:hypothetical protein